VNDDVGVHILLLDIEVLFDRDESDISLNQGIDQRNHFRRTGLNPTRLSPAAK
jgi:hypothetical protein